MGSYAGHFSTDSAHQANTRRQMISDQLFFLPVGVFYSSRCLCLNDTFYISKMKTIMRNGRRNPTGVRPHLLSLTFQTNIKTLEFVYLLLLGQSPRNLLGFESKITNRSVKSRMIGSSVLLLYYILILFYYSGLYTLIFSSGHQNSMYGA